MATLIEAGNERQAEMVDFEIECPRCYGIMSLYNEFDTETFLYSCEDCDFLLHAASKSDYKMNAVERAAMAKTTADYIVDSFIVEEPVDITELDSLVRDIVADRVSDKSEIDAISILAKNYVMEDPSVDIKSMDESDDLFLTYKMRSVI